MGERAVLRRHRHRRAALLARPPPRRDRAAAGRRDGGDALPVRGRGRRDRRPWRRPPGAQGARRHPHRPQHHARDGAHRRAVPRFRGARSDRGAHRGRERPRPRRAPRRHRDRGAPSAARRRGSRSTSPAAGPAACAPISSSSRARAPTCAERICTSARTACSTPSGLRRCSSNPRRSNGFASVRHAS